MGWRLCGRDLRGPCILYYRLYNYSQISDQITVIAMSLVLRSAVVISYNVVLDSRLCARQLAFTTSDYRLGYAYEQSQV